MMLFFRCVFKGRDNKLFLYAATNIKKGEKITHSWTKNVLQTNTRERQKLLKNICLNCECQRCSDPTEMGTNARWLLLLCNKEFVVLKNPLSRLSLNLKQIASFNVKC